MTSSALSELVVSQWHPTKNLPLSSSDVTRGSNKSIWWQCNLGHDWAATPNARHNNSNNASGSNGCPVCANKKVQQGYNDLETIFPIIAEEWHSILNDDLLPSQVTPRTSKKVWWLGKCGHEWQSSIGSRTAHNTGCPYCCGQKILVGFNDLLTKNPELVQLWHPTKNSISSTEVTSGTNKKVWWQCALQHEWQAAVSQQVKSKKCVVCIGRKIQIGYNNLAATHPNLVKEWHPTKNIGISHLQFSAGTNRKAWWQCEFSHEWEAGVAERVRGTGCPVCTNKKTVAGVNDLKTLSPATAKEWHPVKNLPLLCEEINNGAHKKVWWLCEKGHEWITSVFHRTKNRSGCPYCSGQKLLLGFNDLASASPDIAKEWHPTKNGNLQPSSVNNGTPEKAWWLDAYGHEWESSIRSRTSSSNRGCPYCAGKQVLSGYNDLATTHPSLTKEWHPTRNGKILASMVTFGMSKKYWWICEQEHAWMSLATDRIRGNGCPKCSKRISKAEQAIADFLILQGLDVEQSNRKLIGKEMDIYIPEKKTAIEYNGLFWHSERVGKGKSKNYHYDKWLAAKNAGIHLIQIWDDEWNRNPEQVKAMLLHKLGISNQEKVFARKTFVSKLVKPDVESFLNTHHIQGYASGSYYLGLRDKETAELVAVMTLRKAANNTLNIVRYATSRNVAGGFTRLLNHAELAFSPARFVTSSDNCVSDGSLYASNGFIADKELAPDYRYVVKGERKQKSDYRVKRFREDPFLQWKDGLTEKELADLNSIPRIWDAGGIRWVKTFCDLIGSV